MNKVSRENTLLFPKNKEKVNSFIFSAKFINLLMTHGKKIKAYSLYFAMLDCLKNKQKKSQVGIQQSSKDSSFLKKEEFNALSKKEGTFDESEGVLEIVSRAIKNCMPNLEVRKVRIAGSTYLVPAIISKRKQEALAMRWIIETARKRKKMSKLAFCQCLADEIFDAFSKQGNAREKRDELHRLAEANRAYIRYRWW
jgi:small subunit ribosomal protein S7